jgi:type I restriction enzyme S subunit
MAGEWQERPLRELVEIFDGPHATPAKTKAGPIFLGISNLAHGRLNLSEVEHVSDDNYVRWTRRVEPRAGDIVFSYETRLGEAARVPPGLRCCLGRRMGLLRARNGEMDERFLLYAYLGPQFQETLRARTVPGSTVDRIPLIDMPQFPMLVPTDLDEQRAIAHILGTLDDKIELNRRMNETLEAMARALFKSWFVDFDPVLAKAAGRDPGLPKPIADLFPDSFEDSELGEIPRGVGGGQSL